MIGNDIDFHNMHQRGVHVLLGLVAHRAVHCPTGADIGDGQGGAELALAMASFVADQIDLYEAENRVIPFSPGTRRDPGLE